MEEYAYKINTNSHWANSPFFWDIYDTAEELDMWVDYAEKKDKQGNYHLTKFVIFGTDEQFDKLFSKFKNLKKDCKKIVDEKLNETKAIHWGDLDYGKKADSRKIMGGRGTGHFGTGFYFVGAEGPYGIGGKRYYDYACYDFDKTLVA